MNTDSQKHSDEKTAKVEAKRTRITRIYPAWTFEQSLPLAEAIQKHASGERVYRLTLLKAMDKSPTASTTQNLITNSSKYGLTTGGHSAEYLELTPEGRLVTSDSSTQSQIIETKFKLAIERIKPFQVLYDRFKGKRLPSHEVLADTLRESQAEITDIKECIDVFITNSLYLGLLQMLQGTEMLLTIEARLNEVKGPEARTPRQSQSQVDIAANPSHRASEPSTSKTSSKNWDTICFYISPIGQDDSEERKHSDLFLNYLIEPALKNFGLEVVRAEKSVRLVSLALRYSNISSMRGWQSWTCRFTIQTSSTRWQSDTLANYQSSRFAEEEIAFHLMSTR